MDIVKRYTLLYIFMNTGFIGNLLIVYYLSKGLTYAQIGIATSILTAGFFLFEVPTGVVADKMSRKLSVLVGFAINITAMIFLIFLRGFPMLLIYAIVASFGATFVSGSLQAWLFDNLKHLGMEREYRSLMRDIKTLTIPLSALAIAIGGILAQLYGFWLPLLLTLILEIATLIVAYTIPEYEFKKPERSYLSHTLHSFKDILQPQLFWLVVLSITVVMATNQFRKFFEPYLGEILAKSLGTTLMGTLGLLGIVESIVKIIPRLIGVRLRDSWSVKAYSLAPVVIPVLTALSVVYQNPLWIIAIGIFVTVIHTAFSFNLGIEIQYRIPSEKRATILSVYSMVSALVMSVFYFIYGFAVDWLGLGEARLVFAIALLVVGIFLKAGEIVGPLGETLRLRHAEAIPNER
ncbi:MFS transporter [Thermococcus sp. GR7]|uniref:MFS transporter n=1 Tax=unclassified Thermococcus TaxID=2627626 RepID=UPI0014309E36|nr:MULTISPECIES: MFS transporter [unclassified Thermococcus]NJE46173.1 MFS transporter [Thermococcus sp. GR7]NJE78191.1 MFS transporter [Thermococcus sp. GR4]NJF23968.1 MFS transporter [Thermococcus sp. GR5]